ncbi:MAG TPA: PepSY domain-containing protein [Gammaproteobacteria bacterium]|nr:PepSY domain-containing protein [Gammaproteobacteria bacterium]
MRRSLLIFLLMLPLTTGARAWTVPAAVDIAGADTALFAAQSGVSLAQATQLALQVYPGQVVRAETVNRGGRREHRIRILGADGRVRTVRVDAQTGAIL